MTVSGGKIQTAEEMETVIKKLGISPDWYADTAKVMLKFIPMHESTLQAYTITMNMYIERGISEVVRHMITVNTTTKEHTKTSCITSR